MRTLSAEADYGNSGQYVAVISGRDPKFTFAREFIGRKGGKRNDVTTADVDQDGLYEECGATKRGKVSTYYVLLDCPHLPKSKDREDTLKLIQVDKADAMKIAKALDDRRPLAEIVAITATPKEGGGTSFGYELLSPRQAEQKAAAQTLDSAVAACWAAMEALPLKEQKKVLAALKLRITSPKEESSVAEAPAEPAADQPAPPAADESSAG